MQPLDIIFKGMENFNFPLVFHNFPNKLMNLLPFNFSAQHIDNKNTIFICNLDQTGMVATFSIAKILEINTKKNGFLELVLHLEKLVVIFNQNAWSHWFEIG